MTDNWDASLSYDVLEQDAATAAQPIFVGRQELLGPIVNAIGQPDRRGTYLISGYRGAGKTSLVIEAARQARAKLEPDWHILPVVLNVSEVSASLSDASRATVGPLQIDARRMLTALLRQLRNKLPVDAAEKNEARARLARKIDWAYTKADAAQYVERSGQRLELRRSELIQSKVDAQLRNALKLLAALAAVAAAAVGAGVVGGGIVAVLAALVGVAAVSLGWSRTASRGSEGLDTAEIELTTDNSVHQLENELKDVFTELYKLNLRTLVVLEELDKVDDVKGRQLDSVIRYFKNLFTQAPALFFFITDKQYYDLIETKIEQARRQRTYSVEHTFFTHRVFVNRPTVDACLDYLCQIAADPAEQEAIKAIAAANGDRVRDLDSMDLRERLIRVLLFRAEDHIFDLKNAIRGYVNVVDGQSILECDEESLPLHEQALAAFQFLVERKARSFSFRGGRDYANEVLRNCLFAVFDDMDPAQERELADFSPLQGPGGDQLGPAEERQVTDAVASLIEDLERGRALERDPPRFTWNENAAVRFKPIAELDPHEESLAQALENSAAILAVLTEGPLQDVRDDPAEARQLVATLRDDLRRIRSSGAPMRVEDTSSMASNNEATVARMLAGVFDAHRARLAARLGRELAPVGTSGSVWTVSGPDAPGDVLLVYGTGERLQAMVTSLFANAPPDRRFSIVNVVAAPADPTWSVEQRQLARTWWTQLAGDGAPACSVSVLPLHEGLAREHAEDGWTMATADELLLGELWAAQAWRRMAGAPEPDHEPPPPSDGAYLLRASAPGAAETSYDTLEAVLGAWLASEDEILAWVTPQPTVAAVAAILDKPVGSPSPYIYLPASASVPAQADAVWAEPDVSSADPESRLASLRRLIEAGRIVLGLDGAVLRAIPHAHVMPAGARVLVHSDDPGHRWQLEQMLSPATGAAALQNDADPELTYRLAVLVQKWNPEQWRELAEAAADRGLTEAMGHLAYDLWSIDPEQAQVWRDRLVATGDANAIEQLARGLGEQGSDAARPLLEAAAERGSASAMARLVLELVDSDRDAARGWAERLVATGDDYEIEGLAEALRERWPDEALGLFQFVAERGSAAAARTLALWDDDPVAATWRKRIVDRRDVGEIAQLLRAALRARPDTARDWVSLIAATDDRDVMLAAADRIGDAQPALAEELRAKAAAEPVSADTPVAPAPPQPPG